MLAFLRLPCCHQDQHGDNAASSSGKKAREPASSLYAAMSDKDLDCLEGLIRSMDCFPSFCTYLNFSELGSGSAETWMIKGSDRARGLEDFVHFTATIAKIDWDPAFHLRQEQARQLADTVIESATTPDGSQITIPGTLPKEHSETQALEQTQAEAAKPSEALVPSPSCVEPVAEPAETTPQADAKQSETVEPSETSEPNADAKQSTTAEPTETPEPKADAKTSETTEPTETPEPKADAKTSETTEPTETPEPKADAKTSETAEPTETPEPKADAKTSETAEPTETSEPKADAKQSETEHPGAEPAVEQQVAPLAHQPAPAASKSAPVLPYANKEVEPPPPKRARHSKQDAVPFT